MQARDRSSKVAMAHALLRNLLIARAGFASQVSRKTHPRDVIEVFLDRMHFEISAGALVCWKLFVNSEKRRRGLRIIQLQVSVGGGVLQQWMKES